jgi:hypothetical protein
MLQLNSVVIRAEKSTVEIKNSIKNVRHAKPAGKAGDVLENVPSVSVDIEETSER